MTTAAHRPGPDRRPVPGVLASTALVVLAVALLGALAAALTAGSAAAYGVLVGAAVVLVAFGLGATVVDQVAGLMPAASLLVALLTYVLQLVVLWVVFTELDASPLLEGTLDRTWLGATVIVGSLVWIGGQLWRATTVRILAYDLPPGEASQMPVTASSDAREGGAS